MSQELFFTSAPRGLQAGSSGFCTVAVTRGLPPPLRERLEALSAYRHLLPPLDPNNPVAYSHLQLSVAGRTYHVLSRIGPAGLDYSQRSNKFAHHVVLGPGELPPGGPAWLLQQPGFMAPTWDGQVRELPAGRTPPMSDGVPALCRAWQKLAGDAGWGGVLAEAFERDPSQTVYLVFRPGQEMLPLLAEAAALLPPEERWQISFSTYYTGVPPGTNCAWRCVAKGSAEAKEASGLPNTLVLDLTAPLGPARGGQLVEQARNGRPPAPTPAPRAEPEWPGEALPMINRRAERAAAPTQRPVPLPPPPPTPVAMEPRNRWRTRWLWLMIGVLIGLLTSSGVTVALAQFGAVSLELARNHDELRGEIEARRTELGELQDQCKTVNEEVASKRKRANELEEQCKTRKKEADKLSTEIRNKSQKKDDLDAALKKRRQEYDGLTARAEAMATDLKELPALRKIVTTLKDESKFTGPSSTLEVAINRFITSPPPKNVDDLKKDFQRWYEERIRFDADTFRVWTDVENAIKSTKVPLVKDKEERLLERSEEIVKKCLTIRLQREGQTFAATKVREQSADVLLACDRVLKSSKSEDRKGDAKRIKEWLQKNPNRSK